MHGFEKHGVKDPKSDYYRCAKDTSSADAKSDLSTDA